MKKSITTPASLQPATELAVDLFDNWFDPIETEVRARSRQFIEELIRGELDAALARPLYGRGKHTVQQTLYHDPNLNLVSEQSPYMRTER